MEKKLKCFMLFPLKEIALRRVSALLWSDPDILISISKFHLDKIITECNKKEWRETIEVKIKEKILKLELPKLLMEEMINMVYHFSLDLRRMRVVELGNLWSTLKETSFVDSTKLCWTAAGRIDYKKTAEELVHCNELDVVERYKLACTFCLEDSIPILWGKLPEGMEKFFCCKLEDASQLDSLWPHLFEAKRSKKKYLVQTSGGNRVTLNQYCFEISAKMGNKTAAEYFFQKLTHEEEKASLMKTAHAVLAKLAIMKSSISKEKFSDVFCYLLSAMTLDQQMEIFKAGPIDVFFCFLDWPREGLFLENASILWTSLPSSNYDLVLHKVISYFRNPDDFFPIFFKVFLLESPPDFKKCFADHDVEISAGFLLSLLLLSGNLENVKEFFRKLVAADKVKLVFHPRVLDAFYKCLLSNSWQVVELCLQEATLTRKDRKELKEAFMLYLETNGYKEILGQRCRIFFELLDRADADLDKLNTNHSIRLPYTYTRRVPNRSGHR